MKKLLLISIFITAISFAYADQWQVLTKEQAENAVNYINQNTDMVLWCACCSNDTQEYVKISKAEYQYGRIVTDMYEVIIHGMNAKGDSVITGIDLAYVHIIKDGTARCLAVELGLDCDPCTEPFSFDIPEIIQSNTNNSPLYVMDFSGGKKGLPRIQYNWNKISTVPIHTIKAVENWTSDIAVTKDEKYIIACGGYFEEKTGLKKYNITTGRLVHTYYGHEQQVETIEISENGNFMISADQSGRVIIWDLRTDKIMHKYDDAHSDWIEGVCISPNSKYAASASRDGHVKIWNINNGEMVRNFKSNFEIVSSAAFTGDNKQLIVGGIGVKDEVCIYDLKTGKIISSYDLHTRWSKDIDTNPEGDVFISSGDDDNNLKSVNFKSKSILTTAVSPYGSTSKICYDPTGRYIAVAAMRGIYVWDTEDDRIVFQASPNKFPAEGVAFSSSGNYLAACARGAEVYIWKIK